MVWIFRFSCKSSHPKEFLLEEKGIFIFNIECFRLVKEFFKIHRFEKFILLSILIVQSMGNSSWICTNAQ